MLFSQTEDEEVRASIEKVLEQARKLSRVTDRLDRKLLKIGSWSREAEQKSTAAALRYKENKSVNISADDMIASIRSFASVRYNLISGVIPKILLISKLCNALTDRDVDFSAFLQIMRFLVERYVILKSILETIQEKRISKVSEIDDFLFIEETITAYGIATRFNWQKLLQTSFEEFGADSSYSWDGAEGTRNFQSKNILSFINKVDKMFPGLKPYYEYCCEFVHPNIGDVLSVSFDVELFRAMDGSMLRVRKLGFNRPTKLDSKIHINGDRLIMLKTFEFSLKVFVELDRTIEQITPLLIASERWLVRSVHRAVKRNKILFKNKDLCPCGSSKPIKTCLASK